VDRTSHLTAHLSICLALWSSPNLQRRGLTSRSIAPHLSRPIGQVVTIDWSGQRHLLVRTRHLSGQITFGFFLPLSRPVGRLFSAIVLHSWQLCKTSKQQHPILGSSYSVQRAGLSDQGWRQNQKKKRTKPTSPLSQRLRRRHPAGTVWRLTFKERTSRDESVYQR
jgi:hypothetical protein